MADDIEQLLERADRVLEEGSEGEIEALLGQLRGALNKASESTLVELYYALAGGLVVLGDHRGALEQYGVLRGLPGDDPELDYWEAVSLFHVWRFDESREKLRRVRPTEETEAGVSYYDGLLWEFAGEFDRAERSFVRAAELDPTCYHRPHRLPVARVEALLDELVQRMPSAVRAALGNVQISVASLPEKAVHDQADVDPLVLGLYTGVSLLERDSFGGSELPERVEVFQRNVERVSRDDVQLRHELEITLKHEVGHHLGWDEDDLADRGLA